MLDLTLLRTGVLVVLFLAVGGVAAVTRLHWVAYRRLPRGAGLTPLHVALVSLGVVIWGGALAWALAESLGREATVPTLIRTCMYGAGAVVILAALVVVGRVQRRRVRIVRAPAQVVVRAAEHVVADVDEPPR